MALDAVTLLPVVGGAGKAAKIVKALTSSKAVAKAIKIISAAGAVGGVANVALSWDNLVDGKWTINDVRTVVNGLRGLTNIHRIKGTPTKAGNQSDTVTLKADGKNPITITKTQYDKIKGLPASEQKSAMANLIKKQASISSSKTDEEALKEAREIVDKLTDKNGNKFTGVVYNNKVNAEKARIQSESAISNEDVLSLYDVSFKSSKPKFS